MRGKVNGRTRRTHVGVQKDTFGRSSDGYYTIGSPSEAANKFAFYKCAYE